MKIKQLVERITQLEEGLAVRHAEYVGFARERGLQVHAQHPLLQEELTKIKKMTQSIPVGTGRLNDYSL